MYSRIAITTALVGIILIRVTRTTKTAVYYLGNQGSTNFALFSDPTSVTSFYTAGTGGLVFEVNPVTAVWTLISSPTIYPPTDTPSYNSTQSSTAPHADARNFAWDYNTNELLITNDGGLYKRSNPRSPPTGGDWITLTGIYNHGSLSGANRPYHWSYCAGSTR